MKRLPIAILFVALVCGGGAVLAQNGLLAGVTMRVVESIAGLDAVIIELPAPRSAD